MMDFIYGLKRWWEVRDQPRLRCLVSFDIKGKQKWVVEVNCITNRGGVTYRAPHTIPEVLMEYTRHCMVVMDFQLQWKDCVKFVFFDSELTLVVVNGAATVPAYDERYPKYEGVQMAHPTGHTSGIVPEKPGLLLVHPSWGGVCSVLVTTMGDPKIVNF